ncbi:MAG TPA: hypothetical protein VN615_16955 [Gaiellales bacterium]|nr:hypothetical protein [Gaiellales bacterium]
MRFPARLLLGVIAAHAVLGVGSASAAVRPEITLWGHPAGLSNVSRLRLHWTPNFTPARATCTLDEREVPCGHELIQTRLTTGKHIVQVMAWRADGAVAVARTHWWTDLVPPSVPQITGTPTGWLQAGPVLLIAHSTDGQSQNIRYEYRFHSTPCPMSPCDTDPDGWQHVTGINGNWDRIQDFGTTTVEWRAQDRAGNYSAWTAPQVVRIDYIAPTVTTERPPPGLWHTGPVTVSATATDVGSGVAGFLYETTTGNGIWSAPQPGDSVTITADGLTGVRFAAYDAVGNMSPWQNDGPAVTGAWIDTTPPTLTTPYGAGRWTKFTAGVITWAADSGSGVASVEYETSTDGGGTWSDPQPGHEAWISQEGITEVRFRATDQAGNVTPWTIPTQLTTTMVDTTPPTLQLAASGSGAQTTVTATAADSGSGVSSVAYELSSDGGVTWTNYKWGATTEPFDPATTLVRFQATDTAGNTSAWVSP